MDRRTFIYALTGGFVAAPLATEAQQAGTVNRIGLLSPVSQGLGIEAFREGLRTLGYVEGDNIVVEYRSAEGRFDRLRSWSASRSMSSWRW